MFDISALPRSFVWGAATSSYQIEGAVDADNRSPSIWDTYCQLPGAIDNGDTGRVACDHYHRYAEDVELMRALNLDAYRFSVAWPRVIPGGTGAPEPAGIGFYDRLVDKLLAAGIRPFATLYHWDLPQVLQDRGGWPARETAYAFADYAAVVAAALGDRVKDWMTVNEPPCIAWMGHLDGTMAPGERDIARAVAASHHVLLGHGLAADAIRSASPSAASVGIALNLNYVEPATDSEADREAAVRMDGHLNRWWLDPLFCRGYPADMVGTYRVEPPVQDGDLDVITTPTDFFAVNYYSRQLAVSDPEGPVPYAKAQPVPAAGATAMGWEVYPDGLEQLLLRLKDDYGAGRLYLTENGSAWPDEVAPDGTVADPQRIAYLEQHLQACATAVGKGVDLAGYFAWSLMDNFEWACGYDKRFGLVHVDWATQRRTIKQSGHRYAEIIQDHRTGGEAA